MRGALPLLVLLALAGCDRRDESLVRVALIGTPEAIGETKGVRLSPAAQLVRAATTAGLVGFDGEGRVVPALADRWIVTEDGQSYIFRLRNGTWPDGTPITGESAARALRRSFAALRGTALGIDLRPIEEVRAMAGRVVEIRLSSPLPDLLDLLAQPELGLPYKGKGSGPMELERQGAATGLAPIPPEQLGLPAEEGWKRRVRTLRLRAEPAADAVRRFDEGYADVVLGGTADTLPLVKTAGLSRGTVRLDPVIGLFGLAFAHDDGFFAEPANREAIAMAIDRDALLAEFNIAGWTSTTRIVSPDVDGDPGVVGERWVDVGLAERQRAAAARVARWAAGRKPPAPLRVALPDTPGGRLILARLRADLGAIGLTVRRVSERDPADLRLVDSAARYGRAAWFLNQLSCGAGRPVCSAEADAKVAEARAAPDAETRAALLTEAERLITDANGFIPLARPLRWSLVRGDIAGFAINPWGVHPLLPLALAPR
ncbi:MAG TPA: ABC transporter substrate-binding protein [Novosphingobium sp.]|nr:ABC transporter substrate-binding protein [Novosphingobium sp.]